MDTAESEEDSRAWSLVQSSLLPRRAPAVRGGWRATPPLRPARLRRGLRWLGQAILPACAAASVAGAWNALAGGGRRGPLALRQDDVPAPHA